MLGRTPSLATGCTLPSPSSRFPAAYIKSHERTQSALPHPPRHLLSCQPLFFRIWKNKASSAYNCLIRRYYAKANPRDSGTIAAPSAGSPNEPNLPPPRPESAFPALPVARPSYSEKQSQFVYARVPNRPNEPNLHQLAPLLPDLGKTKPIPLPTSKNQTNPCPKTNTLSSTGTFQPTCASTPATLVFPHAARQSL